MKKLVKIVSILMIALMMVTVSSSVFATFTPGSVQPNHDGTGNIQTFGNRLVGILQVVGIIASVAILIVLGIKYMMGSAEEKAEYKKTMIPYLIGAVLIFAASALAQTVFTWAQSLTAGA
ncbi:MAG: TrbC/VirB2 family protein [Clostridia bacterium]|nr:TrbC/VirB2 family protein [Clostridia bacterium]